MALKYDESSIKILEGLDAVRKRPGMYIGSTDKRGLHHLVWEIVDNSIDEVINGFGDYIKIIIHEDGSVSVEDRGRGLPVGMHSSGKSTPEVIFTVLHAGGKFETSGYKVSGGLHGVGASVVNALSKWCEVTRKRDGYEYYIKFENGGRVAVPLKKIGTTNKHGTTVRFMPDYDIFKGASFSYTTIRERMQESAFLLKGLTVELQDIEDKKDEKFCYEDGLSSFVEMINENKKTLHNVYTFEGIKNNIEVKSITVDNGLEFSVLVITAKKLGVKLYKCDPYCSFQRGTNERTNALVRRYIPKGESMKLKPQIYLDDICFNINSMPRKIFDFKSVYDIELNYK